MEKFYLILLVILPLFATGQTSNDSISWFKIERVAVKEDSTKQPKGLNPGEWSFIKYNQNSDMVTISDQLEVHLKRKLTSQEDYENNLAFFIAEVVTSGVNYMLKLRFIKDSDRVIWSFYDPKTGFYITFDTKTVRA